MSATSSSVWTATETVRDELADIAKVGVEMYANLEADDDPEAVANFLSRIQGDMSKLSDRLDDLIPAIRGVGDAFDKVAAVKS